MIMEDFAPFEIAKKLKEKGFPIKTKNEGKFGLTKVKEVDILPSISQVLKWLREEKQIDIYVTPNWHSKDQKYYVVCIVKDRDYNHGGNIEPNDFQSYEQSAIAGIEYALDNLI